MERELRDGGSLRDIRNVASSIADNAARISALFHVFERVHGALAGRESFDAAARVAEWHLHEARRFYGELAMPEELTNASKLEAWMIGYCHQHGVEAHSSFPK